jgi:hypothetical protein
MGIDIFVHWKGQTDAEIAEHAEEWLSTTAGGRGYLREAYHGSPYATEFLCAEAFETGKAQIKAEVLRARLTDTLALVEERAHKIYSSTDEEIEALKQSFRDFVDLCERKETETGEPVEIIAWF